MLFKKKKTLYDKLKEEVFKFPGTKDIFRLSDYMGGFLIAGSPRSGKTSFALKHIVKSWFAKGYGGFYSTTRVNDAEMIAEWANESKSEDRVLLFGANTHLSMNILEYEMNRPGGGDTNALADLILQVEELIANFESGGGGSKGEEPYWRNQTRTMLSMTIELLKLAGRPIAWKTLRKIAIGSFDEDDLERYINLWAILNTGDVDSKDYQKVQSEYNQWRESNWFLDAFDGANSRSDLNERQLEQMTTLGEYWLIEYPKLSDKPKSIIKSMIISVTRPFEMDGILKDHFADGVSHELLPNEIIDKKTILVCGFGVKEYGVQGVIATAILKLIYQKAWERRDLKKIGASAIPVMICLDEFQLYINPKIDQHFCSTAGGSFISQVYITQNLDNLILASGGATPESQAKSLVGNLNCKLFCANSNVKTNAWASEIIGSHFIDTTTTAINLESANSQTFNQLYHPKVPPSHFTTMAMGSSGKVETIIFQVGRKWLSNEEQNFCEVTFKL